MEMEILVPSMMRKLLYRRNMTLGQSNWRDELPKNITEFLITHQLSTRSATPKYLSLIEILKKENHNFYGQIRN